MHETQKHKVNRYKKKTQNYIITLYANFKQKIY